MTHTTENSKEVLQEIIIRKYMVSIHSSEKWSDPRELQIDLDADWINTKNHPDNSVHSDRVMPMKNFKKFVSTLRRLTKCFKGIDDSHFWVSGYYALHFYLKDRKDRLRMKQLVKQAVEESGGFMSWDEWYNEHNKKHLRIVQYNGSGSNITKTFDNLTNSIAFL